MALVLALAVPVSGGALAATQVAQLSATVNKPLQLTRLQDLDLGTITLNPGSWSGATIGVSQTGVFTCSNPNLVCTGVTQPAKYNVQGTNRMVVQISAPNVTLVNQQDSTKTLTLVTDGPGSVILTSSGVPGVDFAIGGSITLDSSAAEGLYAGTFNVTVDY
jgi:spore coat protein U-like protein